MSDTLNPSWDLSDSRQKLFWSYSQSYQYTKLLNYLSSSWAEEKPLRTRTSPKLNLRLSQLLETDWARCLTGAYPIATIDNPWSEFFRYYLGRFNMLQIWEGLTKEISAFSRSAKDGYPSYYLQNFHHQTDGYFEDLRQSVLTCRLRFGFGGSADVMRRRILAPLEAT